MSDFQLPGNLAYVGRLALECKCCVARENAEGRYSGQVGDNVFRESIAEVLLLRIAADVGKGKDCDRRLVRESGDECDGAGMVTVGATAAGFPASSLTIPTKRIPLRGNVLIRRCASPLSPIAVRAALMQVVSADSETMRPFQMAAMRSSLLTTCSRFRITCTRRSNTLGSTDTRLVAR